MNKKLILLGILLLVGLTLSGCVAAGGYGYGYGYDYGYGYSYPHSYGHYNYGYGYPHRQHHGYPGGHHHRRWNKRAGGVAYESLVLPLQCDIFGQKTLPLEIKTVSLYSKNCSLTLLNHDIIWPLLKQMLIFVLWIKRRPNYLMSGLRSMTGG